MRKGRIRVAGTAGTALVLTVAAVTAVLTASADLAAAATATFTPVADTYVQQSTASTNYGTATQFIVDSSPARRSFLRFTVSGISSPITSVKLRIKTTSALDAGSAAGGVFKAMSNKTWSETGTTWNNQPAIDGATVATLGAVVRNTWYEINVTSIVTGNGTFSFGASSSNSDGAYYDSRESGADSPQLVVTTSTTPSPSPSVSAPAGDPVLVGAGDIASDGKGDDATAALLDTIPGTVFTTGDNVYTSGTAAEFATYYEPTWGRHKARTRPAPGNHDYYTAGAADYYSYFGAQAGAAGVGYYSYNLGNWHVVALNSNIAMSAGSAQEAWLRGDLAANTRPCTLAYWHHPLFTSGANHAPDTTTRPLYQALYDYNADVVVWGHNHQYERFAPMNPAGVLDNARGMRSFVAGMGGADFYGFGTIQANSQARNSDTWGLLKFTLHAGGYDWQFVPEEGGTYSDSGTGTCH
ncbi:DNRLRE domain-containing protein [Catellatospora sp. KI3]|uniref:CBM96 family carbohydrate-binding protein n=1 Tax=Catellatospora sp. KI3 TaxID=3041620 RepID=UPI002483084B|nr:DNRLRE domain-containing protein [Catellatospora sp. KI3]MDI1463190.1 DNRLRE domain-containing protein [Catellatospora sp. KI3]